MVLHVPHQLHFLVESAGAVQAAHLLSTLLCRQMAGPELDGALQLVAAGLVS